MTFIAGIAMLILLATGFSERERDGEGSSRPHRKKPERDVQNLTAEPRINKIKLTWDLNDDENVDHIEIFGKYFNDQHFWRYDGFHRFTRSVELYTDPLAQVTLRVVLVAKDGSHSPGKEVTATALDKHVVFDEVEGRKLLIYLPEGYHQEHVRYPVIYMHDGQNLFSERLAYIWEWKVDEVLERLVTDKKVRKCVVVGIYNSSKRAEEYTPFADKRFGGGKAREFSEFVVEKIVPYVESRYRVSTNREDRAVMGSSFGGILSLWMGYTYPQVFSMVAAISPSLWVADGAMLKYVEDAPKLDIRIWMDQGTGEWSDFTRNMVEILINKGYRYGRELIYYEAKDAKHDEVAWSQRIECPFIMFKGKAPQKMDHWRVDIDHGRQYALGELRTVVNPVAHFNNGIWHSLYSSARYCLHGKTEAVIDHTGRIEFNGARQVTVKVDYEGHEKTITVKNPTPPPEPKKAKSEKEEKKSTDPHHDSVKKNHVKKERA